MIKIVCSFRSSLPVYEIILLLAPKGQFYYSFYPGIYFCLPYNGGSYGLKFHGHFDKLLPRLSNRSIPNIVLSLSVDSSKQYHSWYCPCQFFYEDSFIYSVPV